MPQNKLRRDPDFISANIPGFPGYRTRDGRSGLDPLETRQEAAHMEGVFYRNIFTLRVRTRNVFYLALMFVFGVIPFVALLFLIITTILDAFKSGDFSNLITLLSPSLLTAITGAITINFILSILEIAKIIPSLHRGVPTRPRDRKKKLPKRRKDFR